MNSITTSMARHSLRTMEASPGQSNPQAGHAVKRSLRFALCAALLTFGTSAMMATPAAAAATASSGSAQGAVVSLNLAPLLGAAANLNVGPLPAVSGTAPPDYNATQSVASVTGALGVLGTVVSTGVVQVNAAGNLAADTSTASATVNNLGVSVAGLIGLNANTVTSSVSASCSGGTRVYAGSTALVNPTLSLLGLGTGISANPAPNTVISVLGVQITLNEQVLAANSMTVTAIRVHLGSALPLIGNLTGDIAIASATASLTSACLAAPVATPDLAVLVGAPAPAFKVGDLSQVPITISNIGTASSPSPHLVTVTAPAALTMPPLFSHNGWSCVAATGTATCTNPAALPAGGTTSFNVPFTPLASLGGNDATVGAVAQGAPGELNMADNSHSRQAPVAHASTPPTPGVPDLRLTIGQPAPALVAGQTSQIPVAVTNIGTADSPASHSVTLNVASGLATPASFTDGGWTCNSAGSTVTCTNPGLIASGNSSAFNVPVTPAASTVGTTPTVNGNTPGKPTEVNLVNNSASMTPAVAVVTAAVNTLPVLHVNYQDPWWNPQQSGWAIGIYHQGDTIAYALYVYSAQGETMWFHGATQKQSTGVYGGPMYLSNGPAHGAALFDPNQVGRQTVGNMTITFSNAYTGTLDYTVNNVRYQREITRQTFAGLGTLSGAYRFVRKTTLSGCTSPSANGTTLTNGNITIQATGDQYSASTSQDGGSTCTTTGTFTQYGSLYAVANRVTTCPGSVANGNALIRLLESTFIEDSVAINNVTGCVERVTATAVR